MSPGFVSPGVMVGFTFIVKGMHVTPRPVLWERDRFGGGGSVMVWGGVSQHHWSELVVIARNFNAVRYWEDILLPHAVPFLLAILIYPPFSPDCSVCPGGQL